MSLALIQESAKEIRRLAIAGSALAVGDFRLKKLIPSLEQAGAKVPVFAQVAKAVGDLVNGKEADSTLNLLNASTLLNAILYTQGQSTAEGEYREIEMFTSNCSSTRTTARMLKPIVQALTSTGGGRLEIVKTAVERGAFNDLRLIDPSIQALGDIFPELADLVADRILPAYGPGIVPRLKAGLDLKGKRQDARRLEVMHRLDPEGTLALCKSALEDGSPEVKVAAIVCLGKHEECLPLVLEEAKSRNKTLRQTALAALATHDLPQVEDLFVTLIQGKDYELLIAPLRLVKSSKVFNALLHEGKQALAGALKKDGSSILRFFDVLQCFEQRKDAASEEFLVSCLQTDGIVGIKPANSANCVVTGPDLVRQIAEALYSMGSASSLGAVLAHQEKVPPDSFHLVLNSALLTWPPKKVFDEFNPLLTQTRRPGKETREALEGAIVNSTIRNEGRWPESESVGEALELRKVEWDARWLDTAIKADNRLIVSCLARPGHKAALKYLLKAGEGKKTGDQGLIIQALARCAYPKVTDFFLELVSRNTKGAKMFDYDLQFLFAKARHLPAVDLPKLDEFAATLDEKFVDHFLEAIAPLRSVTPSN